jgi:hypothetical protein
VEQQEENIVVADVAGANSFPVYVDGKDCLVSDDPLPVDWHSTRWVGEKKKAELIPSSGPGQKKREEKKKYILDRELLAAPSFLLAPAVYALLQQQLCSWCVCVYVLACRSYTRESRRVGHVGFSSQLSYTQRETSLTSECDGGGGGVVSPQVRLQTAVSERHSQCVCVCVYMWIECVCDEK